MTSLGPLSTRQRGVLLTGFVLSLTGCAVNISPPPDARPAWSSAPRPIAVFDDPALNTDLLMSWQTGTQPIHAVRLENRSDRPLALDPARLSRPWRSWTVYAPRQLAPRGDPRGRAVGVALLLPPTLSMAGASRPAPAPRAKPRPLHWRLHQ